MSIHDFYGNDRQYKTVCLTKHPPNEGYIYDPVVSHAYFTSTTNDSNHL